MALEVINKALLPETIGGSADLTGSNLTNTPETLPFTAEDRAGPLPALLVCARARDGGGDERHRAAWRASSPMAARSSCSPTTARPSIRLSALMGQRVIYVMTHDSIGLGEDGPTHQPVEHVSTLRAIPNLLVFRPADAVETLECWQLAIERKRQARAILALSRQNLPALRTDPASEGNPVRQGRLRAIRRRCGRPSAR